MNADARSIDNDRFEAEWADAVAEAESPTNPPAAGATSQDVGAVLSPQRVLAWLRDVASAALERGLIDADGHAELLRCSEDQAARFDAIDQDALREVVAETRGNGS